MSGRNITFNLCFLDNKKNSDSEPTIEDVVDDDETTKSTDVRKRRTRKAD